MSGQVVSSTNRSKSSWVREVTHGTTPANPVWNEMFVTSNGLKLTPTRGRSKDIRDDGQMGGTFLLDLQSAGTIAVEQKFRHWDYLWESAVKGAFNRKAVRDNNGTADSVITGVAASTDTFTALDVSTDFVVGALALSTGFGITGNNQLFRCQASTTATAIIAPSSPGLTDEAVPPAAARIVCVGFEGAEDDITATSTGLASTVLDFTTFNIQVGEWHVIDGVGAGNKFATTANRGRARVSAVAAHALTYDILPAGWSADVGSGKSIQVFFPDFCKNGTTITSYSVERQQRDLAAPGYEYFTGMFLNNASMPITGGKEIDLSLEFLGLGGAPLATTRFAGSTDVAAPIAPDGKAYGTMTASSNLSDVVVGGTSFMGTANCYMGGTLKIANNITREALPGPLGTAAINVGGLMVSGNADFYLGSGVILAQAVTDTVTSFSFPLNYASGNREGYYFDLPAIKFTPDSDIPGANQGRKVSGPFEAEPHPVLGYTISICRYWYLPAAV